MNRLTIKDNSLTDKSKFSLIKHLTNKITNKTLENLESEGIFIYPESLSLANDISKEQIILQSINNNLKTGNLMGFLGTREEQLIIGSRFLDHNNDFFFQYLLESVLKVPNAINLNVDVNQKEEMLNIFTFLFPYYLKKALRKGLYKTYLKKSYNDINVKGAIDISRHIRENTPFLGKVSYSEREFSFDNQLMELIRHTIEYIRVKSFGNRLLYKVSNDIGRIITATPGYKFNERKKVIEYNINNPIRHAYYREYRLLQHLCVLILNYDKYGIENGTQQVNGILFDGAWLWEEYIHRLIEDKFYHPMNKAGKGAQELFTNNGRKVGLIYPDFISRDADNRVIADTKYKPVENIGNKDYLQVLAYMYRFDSKKGVYIYPEVKSVACEKFEVNRGSTYEHDVHSRKDIAIIKMGLRVPQNSNSYQEFKWQMKHSEIKFKTEMQKI